MEEKNYTQEAKLVDVEINEQAKEGPFLIVNMEGKFLIALTNKIVSMESFETAEQAAAYINSKPWELIFNSTAVMVEMLYNVNKK